MAGIQMLRLHLKYTLIMQQLTLDTMPGWRFTPAEPSTEVDLCSLLNGLKVSNDKEPADARLDIRMAEDSSLPICIPPTCSANHTSPSLVEDEEPQGCAYLQAIRAQIGLFGSRHGDYLQTIFTHREITSAFPPGHVRCARALSDIAYVLEKQAWGADTSPDLEAVTAFRHEAWFLAATF